MAYYYSIPSCHKNLVCEFCQGSGAIKVQETFMNDFSFEAIYCGSNACNELVFQKRDDLELAARVAAEYGGRGP